MCYQEVALQLVGQLLEVEEAAIFAKVSVLPVFLFFFGACVLSVCCLCVVCGLKSVSFCLLLDCGSKNDGAKFCSNCGAKSS